MYEFEEYKKTDNRDYSPDKIRLVQDAIVKLEEELDREPLDEEVAVQTNLELEEVRELKKFRVEKETNPRKEFELRFRMTIKNHELEKAREGKKLLQKQLAEMVGISNVTYCAIECCRILPNPDVMQKLCKILGKSEDELFPSWLPMLTERWSTSKRESIVPMNALKLNDATVLGLPSGDREDVERLAEIKIVHDILKDNMEDLTERERVILEMRFGFKDGVVHTLEETGKVFNVSRDRIRQIEEKALERLKSGLAQGKRKITAETRPI